MTGKRKRGWEFGNPDNEYLLRSRPENALRLRARKRQRYPTLPLPLLETVVSLVRNMIQTSEDFWRLVWRPNRNARLPLFLENDTNLSVNDDEGRAISVYGGRLSSFSNNTTNQSILTAFPKY